VSRSTATGLLYLAVVQTVVRGVRRLGLTLYFSESVTKYVPNREKVWRTIGDPRLLIMASYECA
jgi:hypothetical protein